MLSNCIWPVTQPLAYIVGLHGIVSHGGWYLKSCSALARAGFEVHFLERRGSGLNTAERGDVNGYVTWLTDLGAIAAWPTKTVIGHQLGR